jgi:hypothetical protein
MNKLFFILLLMSPLAVLAQKVKVTSEWSSSIPDLKDLMRIENIDYQKIKFTSPELIGKNYALRVLEIWDGEVRDSALLTSSVGSRPKPIVDSIFEVRVISKIDEQKHILMDFHMPGSTVRKVFKTIPEKAGLYSLRNVVGDRKQDIEFGKSFYFMAYILPIVMPDKPGWLSYCDVDNSGEEVRKWGKELGIEHYLVFEMAFY